MTQAEPERRPKHRLQDMSWAEFRDRLPGRPVVLLPMGAQEEQGPNAPIGDFVLAERISDEVAARTGAVAAPVLPFGDSEFFRTLPGCMSLRPDTLVAVVRDLCASLLDHGLRHLVILNGRTSNAPHLDTGDPAAAPGVRRDGAVHPPVAGIPGGAVAGAAAAGGQGRAHRPWRRPDHLRLPPLPPRAGAARPDTRAPPVEAGDRPPTRSVSSVDFRGVPVSLPLDIAGMTEYGVLSGDSRFSTPAIGRAIAEGVVEFASAFVEHFREQDPAAG